MISSKFPESRPRWRDSGIVLKPEFLPPAKFLIATPEGNSSHNYALRFAAKEAFSKALGVGLRRNGIYWREVEVVSTPSGRPDLHVTGRAAQLCADHGITGMFVSLSDENDFGIAVVILER